jgi:hypothetical protein
MRWRPPGTAIAIGRRTRTPLATAGRNDIVSPSRTEATIKADGIGKTQRGAARACAQADQGPGPQAGLDSCERAGNGQRALRQPHRAKREVAEPALALVDELRTSAAMLAAPRRALIGAGAPAIYLPVFARVVALPRVPI